MIAINQLINELETLPAEYYQDVINYVYYLKNAKTLNIPETMILSESALAKDWNTLEEDGAWENL